MLLSAYSNQSVWLPRPWTLALPSELDQLYWQHVATGQIECPFVKVRNADRCQQRRTGARSEASIKIVPYFRTAETRLAYVLTLGPKRKLGFRKHRMYIPESQNTRAWSNSNQSYPINEWWWLVHLDFCFANTMISWFTKQRFVGLSQAKFELCPTLRQVSNS